MVSRESFLAILEHLTRLLAVRSQSALSSEGEGGLRTPGPMVEVNEAPRLAISRRSPQRVRTYVIFLNLRIERYAPLPFFTATPNSSSCFSSTTDGASLIRSCARAV